MHFGEVPEGTHTKKETAFGTQCLFRFYYNLVLVTSISKCSLNSKHHVNKYSLYECGILYSICRVR